MAIIQSNLDAIGIQSELNAASEKYFGTMADDGCHFCRANLEDLQKQTAEEPKVMQDRVMQSTIGFFRKP